MYPRTIAFCICLILTTFLFLPRAVLAANKLSLSQYLEEVKTAHGGFRAAEERVHAAEDRQGQGTLLFLPKLSVGGNSTRDEKEQSFAAAYGDRTIHHSATVSLQENTPVGLSASVSHMQEFTSLHGVDPLIIPQNQFHVGASTLALSQSLWRNGFGRESRAERDLLNATDAGTRASEKANLQAILYQAEAAYWKFWLMQHTAEIEQNRLRRGNALLNSMQDKLARHLIDDADLQQARAARAARELATQIAESDSKVAAYEFNRWRGIETNVVSETLATPQNAGVATPADSLTSLATQAILQNQKAAAAANVLNAEKLKPELNLFTSATLNHLDSKLSDSLLDLGNTNHPTLTVGIWFSMPLALFKSQKVASAYKQTSDSYATEQKQNLLDDRQEEKILTQKVSDNQNHNRMAEQVLEAQRERVRAEKIRYDSGRSTLMELIQSEDDLATAEITVAQLRVNRLLLLATKRYRGDTQ